MIKAEEARKRTNEYDDGQFERVYNKIREQSGLGFDHVVVEVYDNILSSLMDRLDSDGYSIGIIQNKAITTRLTIRW